MTEGPPVLGSTLLSGIVSRITPSLAEVVSPAVVAAPVPASVVSSWSGIAGGGSPCWRTRGAVSGAGGACAGGIGRSCVYRGTRRSRGARAGGGVREGGARSSARSISRSCCGTCGGTRCSRGARAGGGVREGGARSSARGPRFLLSFLWYSSFPLSCSSFPWCSCRWWQ